MPCHRASAAEVVGAKHRPDRIVDEKVHVRLVELESAIASTEPESGRLPPRRRGVGRLPKPNVTLAPRAAQSARRRPSGGGNLRLPLLRDDVCVGLRGWFLPLALRWSGLRRSGHRRRRGGRRLCAPHRRLPRVGARHPHPRLRSISSELRRGAAGLTASQSAPREGAVRSLWPDRRVAPLKRAGGGWRGEDRWV